MAKPKMTTFSVLFLGFLILNPFTTGCIQTTLSTAVFSMIGHYTNTTCCGLLCWFTCYANQSRILYATKYVISHKCCPGFGPGYPECNPICNDTCGENMVCSAPDTCTCAPGWTGAQCEIDIDECHEGRDECEDKCINIPGLYLCSCYSHQDILAPSNEHRCLSPVRDVHSTPSLNRTLLLTWNLPESYTEDGNFTGLYITCSKLSNKSHEETYNTGITTSIMAHSLIPHTNYTCCVSPQWANDRGPATCINSTTLQDAPEDSPSKIIIEPVTFSTLLIHWVPPVTPNGIISYYTLYINYTNGTSLSNQTVQGHLTTTHLEGLSPYQLVGISISATTLGGEGPSTDYVFNRTKQSEPLEVTDLYVTIILNSTVKVSWFPPLFPNGIITNYHVRVTSMTTNNEHSFNKEKIISSTIDPPLTYFIDLVPFVPYSAQVSGVTVAGIGRPSEFIFFTLESVPRISPVITLAVRNTPTTIDLSWDQMALEDSRGFITQYILSISPSIKECTIILQDETEEYNVTDDTISYTFDSLEPAGNYCISIVAYTKVGKGVESPLNFVQTYEKSFIMVYFSGIHECGLWRQTDTQSKLNQLDEIMFHLLLLNCNCPLSEDYILESHFGLCYNNTLLVYQTYILGTVETNSTQLVKVIKHWGRYKPTVVVQGVQLRAETACDSTEGCMIVEDPVTDAPSNQLTIAVIVIFSGIILGLAACIIIAVAAIGTIKAFSKGRRQNGRTYRPQATHDNSDIEMTAMERFSKLQKETEI